MSTKITKKDLDPILIEEIQTGGAEGPMGPPGPEGPQGERGLQGVPGTPGKDADVSKLLSNQGGKLGGDYFFDGTVERVLGFKGSTGNMDHGFFFNPNGMGIYDWKNDRNVFNYDGAGNAVDITTDIVRVNGKVTSLEGHKHTIADVTGLSDAISETFKTPATIRGEDELDVMIDEGKYTLNTGTNLVVYRSGSVIHQTAYTLYDEVMYRMGMMNNGTPAWGAWANLNSGSGGGGGYELLSRVDTRNFANLVGFTGFPSGDKRPRKFRMIVRNVAHNSSTAYALNVYVNGKTASGDYRGYRVDTTTNVAVTDAFFQTGTFNSGSTLTAVFDIYEVGTGNFAAAWGGLFSGSGVSGIYPKNSTNGKFSAVSHHHGAQTISVNSTIISIFVQMGTGSAYFNEGEIELWGSKDV